MDDNMVEPGGLRPVLIRGIVEIGIFSVLVNVLVLVMPLYLLQIYDRVLPASSRETLIFLSVIAVFALAALGMFEVVRSLYAQRVASAIDKRVASRAFAASLASSRAAIGDIQPLGDLSTVRNFIGSKPLTNLFDLPFVPLFIVLLYFVHPVLCWVTLAGVALLFIVMFLNQAATRSRRGNTEKAVRANLLAQAFVRNADTLRSMGMTRNAIEKWGEGFGDLLDVSQRTSALNSAFGGFSRSLRMLLQLAILGVGAWLVLQGEMTAGMIFASSIISGRALQPLDLLIGGWRPAMDARAAYGRLKTVVAQEGSSEKKAIALPAPTGAIRVRDLNYLAPNAKPGSDPVIKRVSFDITAGEAVAIIGPSRAGKSTLLRLLVGAAEPTSGSIRFDNAELGTWDRDQIGRAVGYLAQDVQLFPGTIAENIARFEPDAADDRVIEAATRAHAHELIKAQADGYQTQIGVSAYALSGGERQRIGLARAFYGEPAFLFLDEPNANLDGEGEAALELAMKSAKAAGRTVVIVTHRLSIAASCDRVMLMRNGMIEAFGPSAEVLKKVAPGAAPANKPAAARKQPIPFTTYGSVNPRNPAGPAKSASGE
jgi:ATP-binding cassette subfamily C protein